MPWKDGYTISDEKSLFDDAVHWPDGQRMCMTVMLDLSLASGPQGLTAADLRQSPAAFGRNEGLAQVRAVLKRFDLKATVTVPAAMARIMPDDILALRDDGHEIAAQGFKHEDVSTLSRDEEASRLALTTEILESLTGERPQGWFSLPRQNDPFAVGTVSPHTHALLIEAGYQYMGNGLADDIPHYWVTDFEAQRAMLTLPYFYHFDDQFFLMFPRNGSGLEHPDSLFANWNAEFDAQYRRGRFFNMTLHPYAVGWCSRLKLLEDFFTRIGERPAVWNATGGDVARYWHEAYPQETTLRLEPSIWKDHPGSLS
jgi:peptidoglycan/xylan/chitin deacetylase (PgdA/CDA1 family)